MEGAMARGRQGGSPERSGGYDSLIRAMGQGRSRLVLKRGIADGRPGNGERTDGGMRG